MYKQSNMAVTTQSQGKFEPIHSAHAIERAQIIIEFNGLIDATSFLEASSAAERFREGLPERVETQGFKVSVGSRGSSGVPPVANPGFVLRRAGQEGYVDELRVDHGTIDFRTTSYVRWDSLWERLSLYFNALVPIYLRSVRVAAFAANYLDKFAWSGDLVECKTNELLRKNSRYVPPHIYDEEDFWHSHTGAFIKVGNDTKRLLNVNLDYLDEERPQGPRRIVAITTIISDQMDQVGYEAYSIPSGDIDNFVASHMQSLHSFGKDVLGDIINDEMCRRIALKE